MQMLVNFVIGYLVFMNIIGFGLIVLITRQEASKKLNIKKVNTFLITITLLGGFIGIMVAGEMTGYKDENMVVKKVIPLIVFVAVAIVLLVTFIKLGGFSSIDVNSVTKQ